MRQKDITLSLSFHCHDSLRNLVVNVEIRVRDCSGWGTRLLFRRELGEPTVSFQMVVGFQDTPQDHVQHAMAKS